MFLGRRNDLGGGSVAALDRPPNAEERMRGEPAVTQFGRMCAKLGIGIIAASSPQAKGRVERAHGTHRDRLVKELRLAGIANYEQAHASLDQPYLAEHNHRYAPAAVASADYDRRRPRARQLDEVFWLEEERVVSEDWVVRYNNRLLQVERQSQHWAPAKSHVLVRENEAGEVAIHYRGQRLVFGDFCCGQDGDISNVVCHAVILGRDRESRVSYNRLPWDCRN